MTTRHEHARHRTQILGAIGLVAIATVAGFLIATYQKAFVDVTHVTVDADRAGLLLDKGARVRLSGVAIGEVRSTELQPNGRVNIDVAIDEDKADLVPSDVVASIRGTTVFGSKYVDFAVPNQASSAEPVKAGAVIKTQDVTIEANDVFAHGLKVLRAVKPSQVNSTLTAVSTALEGRGELFGQFFSDWDRYLKTVQPHLDALETDLALSPQVLKTYADVTPQLIATGDNFGSTSDTLVNDADRFDALLAGAVDGAESATNFLNAIEAPLVAFNREWLPVTSLGAEYAPVAGCIIEGLHNHVKVFDKFFGNAAADEHYFYAKTGFLPGIEPYSLAENRPTLVTGAGPTCYPEATRRNPMVPHVNFGDGTAGVYSEETGPARPAKNPVQVYQQLVADWFGSAALEEGDR
jgi:phospholipid/cholesterol/gamma-HCH transport system substrate-binding protein